MSDVRELVSAVARNGHGFLRQEDARDLLRELRDLDQALDAANQAGRELATALWALILSQQPSMSLSRDKVIEHAEAVVKKYTSEADREQLTEALERAKGLGGEWAP